MTASLRHGLLAATALVSASLLAPVAAHAEAAAPDAEAPAAGVAPDAAGSGDIIVTARHRAESQQSVPVAITAIGGPQLDSTGSFNVDRLQQLVPTLQYYSSNPRNTSVNIRGLGVPFGLTNDGFDNGVGVYVDDVYYARVASATFDFLDVSQVEVLRGPQGTLYGKNTTAGAINITTNQPTFDYEGKAEVSFGNYDYKQAKAAVSGPLSDKLAVRLALSETSRQGTLYDVTSHQWINGEDNLGLRAQLLWKPSDDLAITLAGDFNRQNAICCGTVYAGYGSTQRAAARQFPALAAAAGYTPASLNPFDRVTDLDTPLTALNKVGGVSLRIKWNVGPGTLTSITAWRFWDWAPSNDRDYTGLPITTLSQNPSQSNQYTQELRYNLSGKRVSFQVGAFAFYQRVDTQGTEAQGSASSKWNLTGALANDPSVLNGLTAITPQYLKNTSIALFAQLDWKVTDKLTLQPGVRLNYDKKSGYYNRMVYDGQGHQITCPSADSRVSAQCGIYTPENVSPEFSAWNFSYDFTASYQASRDVMLYATYSKSFKTGGINQNGVPVDGAGNPILSTFTIKPESVHNVEAGIKTQFWNRKATFNFAGFHTIIENFQANVTNGQYGVLRGYLANAGKVKTQGFEADFSVRPSPRFTAYANGAFTDAKYEKFVDAPCPPELAGGTTVSGSQLPGAAGVPGALSPANCDISGQVLPGVSKWAFSYGAEFNEPATVFGKEGQAYVGFDGSYRSRWSSNPSPSVYSWVNGYALSNFRLGFRTGKFDIFGWVHNAFNTDYYQMLTFGPSNTGLIAGQPGDPRMYGLTIKAGF